jgi:O-antigen/teichoic acid export membrane protein
VLRLDFIVGMPLALLLVIIAKPLLMLLFGAAYAASTPVLQLLIFVPVLAGLDQALASVQLVHARQGDDLRVLGSAAISYVVLLVVLIPPFGSVGAAIATLATGFLQLAMRYASTRRAGIVPPLAGLLVRPALAVLVMVGAMMLTSGRADVTRIAAALLAYVVALWAFGAVTRTDLSRFTSSLAAAPGAGT